MTDLGRLNAALAGRYVVDREIGRGGMATVYLARDVRHDRSVAVKVLRPDLAAQLGGERFLREIRIASALQHPNILTLIDSGDANGVLHYVMPYVEGQSLRERINGGKLAVSDAIQILREILDALSYAHARGFVHRDVKPENVILSGRHAMVVDFGVAKAMSAARASTLSPQPPALSPADGITEIGTSIGTPAYMAPEQAAGDPDVDHRADIYAAGIILYEMLAGRPPFVGHPAQVLSAQISKAPEPVDKAAPGTPPALASIVMRCLEKDPAGRYQNADDLIAALDAFATPRADTRIFGLHRRTAAAVVAAVVFLAGSIGLTASRRLSDERWVRTVAIPEIQRLVEINAMDSAFIIGSRAQRLLPNDSVLKSLAPRYSGNVIFTGLPPGTRVWRTRYNDSTGWVELPNPGDSTVVPSGLMRWRFEAPGYHTLQVASGYIAARTARYQLVSKDSSDGRMVLVRGGRAEVALPGLSRLPLLELPDFWIDKHEVTNADFKRFVDAGGYEEARYWEYPVVESGRTLSREDSRKRLVDRSGRPGPATWEGGMYPAGQDEIPVSGVSWYEAMAYAKFAGKSLPTLYHWSHAANVQAGALIIPGSNYSGQGPSKGSSFGGMGLWGTFDMAGNVREWVWNATGDQRFILGGGWNDGSYSFSDAYAQRPLDRSVTNGFRLVKPVSGGTLGSDSTRVAVARQHRDYAREKPVGDAIFAVYKNFFKYDQTPFNAKLDYRDTTNALWIRERWSYDAAYGGERTAMVMLIPRDHTLPYQAVLVVPGSNMLYVRNDSAIATRALDFMVRSGRVVAFPVVKGMYDRNMRLMTDAPMETSSYRDLMVAIVKDVRRGIDWLGTRADIDTSKLAYVGLSFGGRVSPPILANEPRFKTAILYTTGLKMERTMPEVDPVNYLPRIKMPVLMLNGQHDYYFPVESSQRWFYNYLGTPEADKKWMLYPEAHSAPRAEFIRESLPWLDKYLGVPR